MTLPATVTELLKFLDELIPEPAIRPTDNPARIMFEAGRRSVVLQLRELREGSVAEPIRQLRGQGRRVPSKDTQGR